MNQKQIEEMFWHFAQANPEPKGELHAVNDFTFLVAVVLSAQATDLGVNKATRPLFSRVDTPEKMLALGEEALREAIKTIGLFRTKARHVMELSRALIERHHSKVPSTRAELQALPGVGRKTANVVLNTIFGASTIAVDTHIFRLANRTGLAPARTVLEVEKKLERVIPAAYMRHAHHWLILHGRYICKARKPECWRCHVAQSCNFKPKALDQPEF